MGPSLGVLDTRVDLRSPGRRPASGRILSALVLLLTALALGAALPAQGDPPAPRKSPQARGTPGPWPRLADEVVAEFFARNPDRAFERAWPDAVDLGLGSFGTGASLRWRLALTDALARLERCDRSEVPPLERARMKAFQDWLEAELLELDGLAPSATDPSGYVQRAYRTLRAVEEAAWLPLPERQAKRLALLAELPAYLADARLSLVSPASTAIDLALEDLADLEELVRRIEAECPAPTPEPAPPPPRTQPEPAAPTAPAKAPPRKDPGPKPRAKAKAGPAGAPGPRNAAAKVAPRPLERPVAPPREPTPREALEGFRHWLVELRARVSGRPARLDSDRWSRLVRLMTGGSWQTIEIKLSCLRELARLDLAMREVPGRSRRKLDTDGLAARTSTAAAWALELGQKANILPTELTIAGLAFEAEESPRTGDQRVLLRPGPGSTLRACLQLPNRAWIPDRTAARNRGLMSVQQAALGVRYGLAGEGLIERTRRASPQALAVLLENRAVREGFGLFAQDWLARAAWIENPLRADEDLLREFELQRGIEAARLLAALEVHAEGLTLDEVALGFQRRTGLDPETARVEARAAQQDPLRGIGYLGLLELRALEQRLGAVTTPRKGLRLAVLLLLRNPELRPAELTVGGLPEEGPEPQVGEKTSRGVPEKPGRSHKGRSRSR